MNRIKVQSVSEAVGNKFSPSEILSTFCFYYQQYTLEEARKLPYKQVKLMLKIALRQKTLDYINLTQIVSAPHTEKGKAVKKLLNTYKEQLDG